MLGAVGIAVRVIVKVALLAAADAFPVRSASSGSWLLRIDA
jgi:hypothetical protein